MFLLSVEYLCLLFCLLAPRLSYGSPCDGMLTASNENVKAPEVKKQGRTPDRYIQECECLASKNKPFPYGGITCTDTEWRSKLMHELELHEGFVESLCLSLSLSQDLQTQVKLVTQQRVSHNVL